MLVFSIVTSPKDGRFLMKGISERVESQVNEQNGGYLGILAGKVGANLLGNMLADKRVILASEGTNRAGQNF